MKLDTRTQTLIAIGASVAANCQSCLEYHAGKAMESGADPQEIAEAIQIGTQVRQGAASNVDKSAASIIRATPTEMTQKGCGCSS